MCNVFIFLNNSTFIVNIIYIYSDVQTIFLETVEVGIQNFFFTKLICVTTIYDIRW